MVEIANVAVVLPAEIFTDAGSEAFEELSDKSMETPPAGAAAVRVTVAWELFPPVTDVGFKLTELRAAVGLTVKLAVLDVLPLAAVIVTVVELETAVVVTAKVALELPAATVIEAGTEADEELSVRLTVVPAAGAGPVKVTVPVEPFPPTTVVGFKLTEYSVTDEATVNAAVLLMLPYFAVMVALWDDVTVVVVMVKVAFVFPAVTVTDVGSDAAEELSLRVIDMPAEGASPVNVTVPCALTPPTTAVGFKVNELKAGGAIVIVAVLDVLPLVAVIVAVVELETAVVATVNVALNLPSDTTTETGSEADEELSVRLTVIPPVGAEPVKVTVPVELFPPVTDVGLNANELKPGVATVKLV